MWSLAKPFRRPRGLVAPSLALTVSACIYGFAGGGLPSHIRTVAILPFENNTADPALVQQVSESVREAMESRLGLRLSSESEADAIVRGTIVRYTPDIPLAIQSNERQVAVTRRRVQLTVNVEIFDQIEGRPLWQRNGLIVDGEYEPPNEIVGRELALNKLVTDIVDGAQSQW